MTVADIRALRSHGVDLEDIKRAIVETTDIGAEKLDALLDDVVARNQAYYTELITLADVTAPAYLVSERDIAAIRRQTWGAYQNIAASMGFLVRHGGRMVLLEPAKAYWWATDSAVLQVESGAISYTEAISNAVRQLADSGLKAVEYESGHVSQLDVAIRRCVMTGVNQLSDQYDDQSAEYLNTRYFEVSAHSGARDIPYPNPWSSHKDWQGGIYYLSDNGEPDPLRLYADLVETTGYGYVDGLVGANCRHRKHATLPGVMEPTYTKEYLDHIDDGLECDFEGKHYSAYEATQKQREIERTIRKLRRRKAAFEAAGLSDDAQAASIRLQRLSVEYTAFSKAAGLPEQRDRMKVLYT